ncbi:hypothetical protein BDV27DRAFT_90307 [Aspergillus caelatus]|uniref:HypA-like protein n=1 Tax=Aspergillus caelatus TaxID=61420 RepID=A0A5N7ALT7_9EURO|nr:uncharacterized protein BDV27DRAFT_90307 [Aspergillus caelatus]KAE8370206.1 hypothetical protein BDV27DRAFT_90307 [Aspergillus caelatus]
MAAPYKIWLTPDNHGVFSTSGLSHASARKVSEVLQHDMENHHVYLNDRGFHNHVVHFMLTIWALGASPETIQRQYEREHHRQRPCMPRDESVISSLSNKESFMSLMHKEEHYPNFLAFFQHELATKGTPDVLNEYLFSRDRLAETMLSDMFSGLLHPIIHLGFAIEFEQPAIIAQALAQAAVHDDYLGHLFLFPAENAAGAIGQHSTHKTLVQLMDEMQADETLRVAAHRGDDEVFSSGILKRASEVLVKYSSQWTVPEDKINEKLAEMTNAAVYLTATAQRPDREIKFDFFFLHITNLSILIKPIIDLPYLSTRSKARLLEMKARMDLLIWASRKMPEPRISDVDNSPIHMGWPEIIARSYMHPSDDGHLAKFVRTVAHAQELCRVYEAEAEKRGLRITGDMWLRIGNMVIGSVREVPSDMWVRGSGFSESWEKFGPRK